MPTPYSKVQRTPEAALVIITMLCGCQHEAVHPTSEDLADAPSNVPIAIVQEDTQRETAFDGLMHVEYIATSHVGRTSKPSKAGLWFAVLLNEPTAETDFMTLVQDAKLPGRLYGLCGLYLVNQQAYRSTVGYFAQLSDAVTYWQGCVRMDLPAKDLVRSSNPTILDIDSGRLPTDLLSLARR